LGRDIRFDGNPEAGGYASHRFQSLCAGGVASGSRGLVHNREGGARQRGSRKKNAARLGGVSRR